MADQYAVTPLGPAVFLSGMDVWRRVVMNLVIFAAAVGVTYLIGALTRMWRGISV